MVRILVAGLALLVACTASAWAAAPPKAPPKAPPGAATSPADAAAALFGTPAKAAGNTEEQKRAAEISAMLAEGKIAEAQAAAEALLKSGIKDAAAMAEAQRIVAECLRKKGDWRAASGAYLRVRDRCDKSSDDYIRNDAIAGILRSTTTGVVAAPGAPVAVPTATTATGTGGGEAAAAPKTLADDDALAEALARAGSARASKIKLRVPAIKRGRTPQETYAAYAPALDDTREMFVLGPNVAADAPHEAACAAGARLKDVGASVISQLQSKFEVYKKKFDSPWSLTNIEKADIQNTAQACKDMAEAERLFQQSLPKMAGSQPWPDQERLNAESQERSANYNQLAQQYVVPRYTTSIW